MPNVILDANPRRVPRKGGIKAVTGEFISLGRLAVGTELEWVSDGCTFPKAAPGLCYVQNPITDDKEFEGITNGAGPIFALYNGVHCFLGRDTDYDQRATALLEQGEARGVEEVLWEWASTTTVPLAATGIVNAIAEAEEAADTLYLGLPVLIMSREMAVRAFALGALSGPTTDSGELWTANGTPVIASASLPANSLGIIGFPTVYAGEVVVTRVMDWTVNQEMALAERVYGIAVDCNFAVTYTVPPPAAEEPGGQTPSLLMILGSIPSSPIPDGTDTTLVVNTNIAPTDEVFIHFSINGGPEQVTPELTEVTPTQYVHNVDGTATGPGDSVELWAVSGTTTSNHITIEVV